MKGPGKTVKQCMKKNANLKKANKRAQKINKQTGHDRNMRPHCDDFDKVFRMTVLGILETSSSVVFFEELPASIFISSMLIKKSTTPQST